MKDSAKHTTSSAACAASSTHSEGTEVGQKIEWVLNKAGPAVECYASALLTVI